MIRTARIDDAQAICDIWNPVIHDTTITFTTEPKTPKGIAARIKAEPFFVLDLDGQTKGFATFSPFRGGPGYRYTMEHSIFLAQDVIGQGHGNALMETIRAEAYARDVHSLIAGMAGDNAHAVAFHEKQGFNIVARIPEAGWKFNAWQDLILMQLHLDRDKTSFTLF